MTSLTKWSVIFSQKAEKEFSKLDKPVQKQVLKFFETKIQNAGNPKLFGKPLYGNLAEFWVYRIGDYRVLCHIQDHECRVVAVSIGHRRDIYT
jgi:mRNA interferase RelE/StbE